MLRRILVLAALAAATLGLTATAGPAQAAERPCYTPHVAGFDTFEVCYNIPLPELSS